MILKPCQTLSDRGEATYVKSLEFLFSLAATVLIAVNAYGYNEPEDFRGIKFGQDLTKQIPQCPDETVRYARIKPPSAAVKALTTPCWLETRAGSALYGGHRVLLCTTSGRSVKNFFDVDARQLDDKLAHIELIFPILERAC